MDAVDARSLLFVPGDRPERFGKAVASGADCIIIDLEDAVAPEAKEAALGHTVAWLADGGDAVVRVNGSGTPWHDAEISALASTTATVMVPKADTVDAIAAVHTIVGDRIIGLVETARGIRDADAMAGAPGVIRLALGNVDLSAELGVDPASHAALSYARGRLIMASAAAGIAAPADGVTTQLDSAVALDADLTVARELGFTGKLCIHPRQVEAVNRTFQPSDEELAWALRVLDAAGSGGVGVVDGAMIDAPVMARARRLAARREALT